MRPKPKSQKQLELEVENFNLKYKVGDKVLLQTDSGEIKEVTVKSEASIMGGHSSVGWFEEISGCYQLDRVRGPVQNASKPVTSSQEQDDDDDDEEPEFIHCADCIQPDACSDFGCAVDNGLQRANDGVL